MVLKNLFKHKVPLYLTSNDRDIEEPYVRSIGYHYYSDLIKDGGKIGINNPDDLYDKLTPFIRYVLSTMKHEHSEPFYSTFNIYLQCTDKDNYENFYEFVKVVHFEINSNFMFEGILPLHFLSRYGDNLFNLPFTIYMKVFCYFEPDVRILEESFTTNEEDESKDEVEEQPKPIEDHFKTDKCVICMEKEPCILFIQCRHICMCMSCEVAKPSLKCPYCRSEILQKIKILTSLKYVVGFFVFSYTK